jgi:ferredoxin
MFSFFNKKKDHTAIVNSTESLTVKVGQNLLATALDAGLAWPHDCRVGSCGKCKCKLVEGKITPTSDFAYTLEAEDLNDGYILACQTRLKKDIKVEVNLLS